MWPPTTPSMETTEYDLDWNKFIHTQSENSLHELKYPSNEYKPVLVY